MDPVGRRRTATSCRTRRDSRRAGPSSGPRKLWTRALGEGHSSILVEGGRLYTMYRPLGVLTVGPAQPGGGRRRARRRDRQDRLGIHRYPAPTDGLDFSQGAGPHAHAADRRQSALRDEHAARSCSRSTRRPASCVWSHDFMKEYGAPPPGRGYTCSPLSYNGTIIVTVGGPGQAVGGVQPADRRARVEERRRSSRRPRRRSSIDVDGQQQLVRVRRRSRRRHRIRRPATRSGATRTRPTGD